MVGTGEWFRWLHDCAPSSGINSKERNGDEGRLRSIKRQAVHQREADGLKFGPVHTPGSFEFANAKDPAGNSISISSRGLS